MYDIVQGLALVCYVLFFVFYGKKYNISRMKSFILGISGLILYLFLVKFMAWAENGFKDFGTENGVRVFGILPIFIYFLARLARINPLDLFDLEGAAIPLMYGVSHFACCFAGCCDGFVYYKGTAMYNLARALTGTNKLPVQAGESITWLILFAIVLYYNKKKNYKANGRCLPLFYTMYGFTRVLWEFLRNNEKIIIFAPLKQAYGYFGISKLALWAAFMFVSGVIVYLIIKKLEDSGKVEKY